MGPYRDIANLFSPNKNVSKSTALLLAGTQAAALVLLWAFSPFSFLPGLGETVRAFGTLWSDGLGVDLATSFKLNVEAIGIATAVSLLLSYSTVMPFFRPVVSLIGKLRFLSMIGLGFFFTLATSNGHMLKLDVLAFLISVFFVTGMADVLTSVPSIQLDLARTLRMGPWRVMWEVVVLGQADKAFDVLRQNAAIGWMMLTTVEGMSRSEGGIGTLLLTENKHFHLASILALQVTILLLGLLQDYAIGFLRRTFCPYADLTTERS